MKIAWLMLCLPVLVCCIVVDSLAQLPQFQFQPEAFPVQIYGWQPYSPWAGGESESAPELADIDGDGKLDMFVGNVWGKITYFHNNGTNFNPDFSFITHDFAGVNIGGPVYGGRTDPALVDIDGDGDLDLFTSDFRGLVHYWRNDGNSTSPQFTWVTDSLENIQVPGRAHLTFADIDGDEDFDLFLGDYLGHIWFYHNVGTPDSFNFQLVTNNFASVAVGSMAAPCFCDLDGDGVLDLVVGDANGHLHYYHNNGTPQNPSFTLVSDNWLGINVGSYAIPKFADINGDGKLDLFVGCASGGIFYYQNIGTPTQPQFRFITNSYLCMDLGMSINPQLVDLNCDGLLDLVGDVGNSLDYFTNIGDSTLPSFVLSQTGYQGISRPDIKSCFCDINGDGKLDLLAGESAIPGPPTIALYLNQGTATNPNLVLYNANFITNPNFFVNVCPSVADIDGDGKLDLFVTDDYCRVFYYHNIGTPHWPNFQLVTSQWQGISYSYPNNGWRSMAFGDLDHDGKLDLVMSNSDYQNLRYYHNNGTAQVPNMVLVTDSLIPGASIKDACPTLVDIDHDGDLDLFCSTYDGGIMFFRNMEFQPIDPKHHMPPEPTISSITLLPNPGNGGATISFVLSRPQSITLDVFNLLGAKVATLASGLQPAGTYNYTWNASGRASGVYIVNLQTQEGAASEKVVIVK